LADIGFRSVWLVSQFTLESQNPKKAKAPQDICAIIRYTSRARQLICHWENERRENLGSSANSVGERRDPRSNLQSTLFRSTLWSNSGARQSESPGAKSGLLAPARLISLKSVAGSVREAVTTRPTPHPRVPILSPARPPDGGPSDLLDFSFSRELKNERTSVLVTRT
jgi:hypothetical protein